MQSVAGSPLQYTTLIVSQDRLLALPQTLADKYLNHQVVVTIMKLWVNDMPMGMVEKLTCVPLLKENQKASVKQSWSTVAAKTSPVVIQQRIRLQKLSGDPCKREGISG